MSRCYRMILDITDVREAKVDLILEAIEEHWVWDEDGYEQLTDGKADIHRQGVSYLGGGRSEEEFARSLALSIWQANEGFCDISVAVFSLDDPTYGYSFSEEHWREAREGRWADHEDGRADTAEVANVTAGMLVATGFDMEPLNDGNVLIEFFGDDGKTFSRQVVTPSVVTSMPVVATLTGVVLREGPEAIKEVMINQDEQQSNETAKDELWS